MCFFFHQKSNLWQMLIVQGTLLLTRPDRAKVQDKHVSIEQADGKEKKIVVIDLQQTIR